jgi:hypothetical protein
MKVVDNGWFDLPFQLCLLFGISKWVSDNTTVRSLQFAARSTIHYGQMRSLIVRFGLSLRVFRIEADDLDDEFEPMTIVQIRDMIHNLTDLAEFCFRNRGYLCDQDALTFASYHTNLVVFDVEMNFSTAGLTAIIEGCQQLQVISLHKHTPQSPLTRGRRFLEFNSHMPRITAVSSRIGRLVCLKKFEFCAYRDTVSTMPL